MNKSITLFILLVVVFSSCAKKAYKSVDHLLVTSKHKNIAVLPFEMILTGQQKVDLSKEEISFIAEKESKAFQLDYYENIYYRRARNKVNVDIQDYKKTLRLLEAEGISIEKSWSMDPVKLCKILGVDAVVRSRIKKQRYFHDAVSYGAEVGMDILRQASSNIYIPGSERLLKSKSIEALYELIDAESDRVIWSISYDYATDWRKSMEASIEKVNCKSIKQFPYKDI